MDEDGAEIAPVEETTSIDAIDDEAIDADASATPATTSAPTASKPPRTKNADTGIGGGGGGDNSYKEAPFTFLAPTDPNVTACLTQLALTPSFPRSHVYARASPNEPVRALYLTTPLLHALMAVTPSRRLRLLSAGARVFVRQGQGDTSRFRVLAEGLPVVRNWVKPEDVITADLKTLRALMEAYYPLCAAFAQPFRSEVEGRGRTYNSVL
jgi:multisite-specific tRNA:(cytosine-C5)-methyltransferase